MGGRLSCILGAALGVFLAASIGAWLHGHGESTPWLAPSVAASAVLVFALPASPMSQPWPVLCGSCLSALIGVALGHALGQSALVCAIAMTLALAAMFLTRSLHPPAAGAAMLGVLGGTAHWSFPLAPLGINLAVLVTAGWFFHRITGHRYPHIAGNAGTGQPAHDVSMIDDEDIDAILAELWETIDVEREDLRVLVSRLEARLIARRQADTCRDWMAR
jgi:CBS domain-containing membrane protein